MQDKIEVRGHQIKYEFWRVTFFSKKKYVSNLYTRYICCLSEIQM